MMDDFSFGMLSLNVNTPRLTRRDHMDPARCNPGRD
jgi:hypothetical protein